MTKEDAIIAMHKGEKVTHRFFSEGEYIYMKDGKIHDEKDYNIDSEFWQHRNKPEWEIDWSISKNNQSVTHHGDM